MINGLDRWTDRQLSDPITVPFFYTFGNYGTLKIVKYVYEFKVEFYLCAVCMPKKIFYQHNSCLNIFLNILNNQSASALCVKIKIVNK